VIYGPAKGQLEQFVAAVEGHQGSPDTFDFYPFFFSCGRGAVKSMSTKLHPDKHPGLEPKYTKWFSALGIAATAYEAKAPNPVKAPAPAPAEAEAPAGAEAEAILKKFAILLDRLTTDQLKDVRSHMNQNETGSHSPVKAGKSKPERIGNIMTYLSRVTVPTRVSAYYAHFFAEFEKRSSANKNAAAARAEKRSSAKTATAQKAAAAEKQALDELEEYVDNFKVFRKGPLSDGAFVDLKGLDAMMAAGRRMNEQLEDDMMKILGHKVTLSELTEMFAAGSIREPSEIMYTANCLGHLFGCKPFVNGKCIPEEPEDLVELLKGNRKLVDLRNYMRHADSIDTCHHCHGVIYTAVTENASSPEISFDGVRFLALVLASYFELEFERPSWTDTFKYAFFG
jgi:hypothetical protein